MSKSRTEGVAREAHYSLGYNAHVTIAAKNTPAKIDERADDHVKGKAREDHAHRRPTMQGGKKSRKYKRSSKCDSEPLHDASEITTFPRQQLPDRHQYKQWNE